MRYPTLPRIRSLSRGSIWAVAMWLVQATVAISGAAGADDGDPWISPTALALSPDGAMAYVASATSKEVLFVDLASGAIVQRLQLPDEASGLALSGDGRWLLATTASSHSQLNVIDVQARRVVQTVATGHSSLSPVLSADGATAFVCNRHHSDVSVIDLKQGKETARIPVEREPVAAVLTLDGKHLLVANHLPVGRADVGMVSAHVTVVDVIDRKVIRQIVLPNGANLLQGLAISPDGRYACVTHTMARFYLPTTQVERGWMNANAFTLIDLSTWDILNTVLLDAPERGCATAWGVTWNGDGTRLVIAHAGSHELSIIDFTRLLTKIQGLPLQSGPKAGQLGYVVSQIKADVSQDLGFLGESRQLVALKGHGPRPVAIHGDHVCVGNYFSETLERMDLRQPASGSAEICLHPSRAWTAERKGEALFNDGRLCLQSWQSCASCHSADARADGLNWDLLNDGIGNPKNTKSLLRAHLTAPSMSMGIRDTAETAVRAGITHILYTAQPEEAPQAMDAWLKSLNPLPSPFLVNGKLSPAATRGREIFQDRETSCASCHSTDLFTNRSAYDVGTAADTDSPGTLFDTPVLLELWRTAPYLHDGSAANLRDVLQSKNRTDQHGRTSHLNDTQITDLVEYLLSL